MNLHTPIPGWGAAHSRLACDQVREKKYAFGSNRQEAGCNGGGRACAADDVRAGGAAEAVGTLTSATGLTLAPYSMLSQGNLDFLVRP